MAEHKRSKRDKKKDMTFWAIVAATLGAILGWDN